MIARPFFTTPRSADFFKPRELSLSMGVEREQFLHMAVKELLDNAIDAAEVAGAEPEVRVLVGATADADIRATVTDNGPGIPTDAFDKVLDFDILFSDNASFRSPTRGQQGNAVKTVIGVGSVPGGHPVEVVTRGLRHLLSARLVSNLVEVTHEITGAPARPGSQVTLTAACLLPPGHASRLDA